MNVLPADGRGGAAKTGLAPWAVLVCGALATGICLLLLFGPFYPYAGTPGLVLQHRLLILLDGTGPRILSDLLWNRFFLSATIVLGVILMLLPWRGARKRHRGRTPGSPAGRPEGGGLRGDAGSTRARVTQRTSSLLFSDDGRVQDPEDPGAEMIGRSVSDLRAMARAARIPWRSDYETSGGARAFLEVLRALNTGPVGVHRAEEAWGEDFVPEAVAEPAEPAETAEPADRPAPAVPSAADAAERPSADESPLSTGSVYTPTTLYRSSTWDRDPEEEEQR